MQLDMHLPKLFCWFWGSVNPTPTGYTGYEPIWKDPRVIPIVKCIVTYPQVFGPPGTGTLYPTPTGSITKQIGMVLANWVECVYDNALAKGIKLKEIGLFLHTFGNWNRGDILQDTVNGVIVIFRNGQEGLETIPGPLDPNPAVYQHPWVGSIPSSRLQYEEALTEFKNELPLRNKGLEKLIIHFTDDFEDNYGIDGHTPTPPTAQGNWVSMQADSRWDNSVIYDGKTFDDLYTDFVNGGGTIDLTQYYFQTPNIGFSRFASDLMLKVFGNVTYQIFELGSKAVYPNSLYNLYGVHSARPNPKCPPGKGYWATALDVYIPQQSSQSIYVYNLGDNGAGENAVINFLPLYDIPAAATNSNKAYAIFASYHKHMLLDCHVIAPDKPLTIWIGTQESKYTITSMGLTDYVPPPQYWTDLVKLNLLHRRNGMWNYMFNPDDFTSNPAGKTAFFSQMDKLQQYMNAVDPRRKSFTPYRFAI